MISSIFSTFKQVFDCAKAAIQQVTKPVSAALILEAFSDVTRSRKQLLVENAMLRQQVIILKRSVKQPKISVSDRIRLVLLARLTPVSAT